MKKAFGVLSISALLLTYTVPVAAQPNFQKPAVDMEQENMAEQDYSKQFNNFMTDAFEHIETLRVNNICMEHAHHKLGYHLQKTSKDILSHLILAYKG